MPQLAPLNWLMGLLFCFMIILSSSSLLWWRQSPIFPVFRPPLSKPFPPWIWN